MCICVFQLDCDSSSVGEGVALTEVVKLVSSLLTTSSDLGLQGSCAWQLGLLVMATTSMADTTTNGKPLQVNLDMTDHCTTDFCI